MTDCSVSDGTRGVHPDAAAVALEDLASLHLRFEDPARRRAQADWVPAPLHDPSYAATLLRQGLDHHRDRLGRDFAELARLYIAKADALHALWQQGPTTVIHGDAHVGNLFDDHGRTGFLDWGIVSLGTPLRDVSATGLRYVPNGPNLLSRQVYENQPEPDERICASGGVLRRRSASIASRRSG